MSDTPSDLLYSKTHEWVRLEGEEAVIGLTFFAQEALGDITYVELPEEGDVLTAGREFGSVESVKAAGELVAPAGGTVLAVNRSLESSPETLNRSPYAQGWIARIKLSAPPTGLLKADAYEAHCAAEKH
jgi:glycine cleavage system H protein